jgi:hypothetical protein
VFLGNVVAALMFLSFQASASTINFEASANRADTAKANKLEVKYIGNLAYSLDFDIHYTNLKGSNFVFEVKDENGEVIYEKSYNDKQFHKTVELSKADDVKNVSFNIYSCDGDLLQSKEVVINTKYVEDVLVKIN